jgi:hypothetical protein
MKEFLIKKKKYFYVNKWCYTIDILGQPYCQFLRVIIIQIDERKGKREDEYRKESKLKALQLTLDKLDKTYGKGTVMKMGDKAIEEVETISSGSLLI